MKRKLLISLLLIDSAISIEAQTKMTIHRKSGGDIEIFFADKPADRY